LILRKGGLMKVELVHINAARGSENYVAMIDEIFERVRRPDTEIVHRHAALRRATDTVFSYPILLNAVSVVHEFAGAQERGADGAMVLCSGDPGVAEARTLLDIPVVGPLEASVHLASMYARTGRGPS
jgi:allantoin racemase